MMGWSYGSALIVSATMRVENRLLIRGREAPDTVVKAGLEETRNDRLRNEVQSCRRTRAYLR
jgi:hypothetical protein